MLLAVAAASFFIAKNHWKAGRTRLSAMVKVLQQENLEYAAEMAEIKSRKNWYQQLFNKSENVVFVYGVTKDGYPGKILEVNNYSCSLLNYSRDELLNMSQADIEKEQDAIPLIAYEDGDHKASAADMPGKYASRASRLLVEKILDENHVRYTAVYVNKSGEQLPMEVTACQAELNGKIVILSTAHDITKRKQAELALGESEHRFRNFFAHSPIGIAIYDANRNLVDVNSACLRTFGVPTTEEFRQVNFFDNPFVSQEIRRRIKNGESVDFEAPWNFDEVRRKMLFVSSRQGTAHLQIIINNLGHDRAFKVKGYFVQVQNITDRKYAETALRQSEKMLRQAEKMEALGSMAGGIAHDFNNILTPLLGYAEIALRSVEPSNPIFTFLEEILKASHRARELVTQILNFSRKTDKEGHPIHLIPIIKEVVSLISSTAPKTITVERAIKTERDIVLADAIQMHQVFMNLCTNAWHSMRDAESGTIEVRVTDFLLDNKVKTDFPGLKTGRYIRISIRDTGSGIEPQNLKHIFDPFFTTKPKGEGTGLGLSVVHNIVTSFHGTISVDTEVGKGSTFHIVLPLLDDKINSLVSETTSPMPTGTERVLIVDDEPEIVEMVAHMLASLGYHPELAIRSNDALAKFKSAPDRYNLVILDQIMPGMSGSQLALELLSVRKDLPIILCTGFSESIPSDQLKEIGIKKILMKPIVIRDLAEAVRNALDTK